MIKEAIEKIVNKEDLSFVEAYEVMNEIMSGKSSQIQNAAYLAALSTKSAKAETIDEISGSALAMREHAEKFPNNYELLDIVGTGGDRSNSFNISTTSAIVLASGGVKVAKHGNRAASSLSGTADCLEALGVNINQDINKCNELLDEVGMCFLFAQLYHKSMKYVASVRKELGFRTVFNILGPLTNPAKPSYQILGVYDEYLLEPIAKVLQNLGIKRALVVYGQDKLDEISPSSKTSICEVNQDDLKFYEISPKDFGMDLCKKEDILGASSKVNADITRKILNGEQSPKRNAVLLNSGAGFYITGKAHSIKDGIELAKEVIDSKKAINTLEKLIKISNK